MVDESSPELVVADALSTILYTVSSWGLIAVGLLGFVAAGFGLLEDPNTTSLLLATIVSVLSVGFIAAGALVNPRFKRRLGRRDSDVSIGTVRNVDERVIRSDESCDERCVVCLERIEEGLVRRYREAYVVAGVPVRTVSERYNHYCLTCAHDELSETGRDERPVTDEHSERELRNDPEVEEHDVAVEEDSRQP